MSDTVIISLSDDVVILPSGEILWHSELELQALSEQIDFVTPRIPIDLTPGETPRFVQGVQQAQDLLNGADKRVANFREVFLNLPIDQVDAISRAKQLMRWHYDHRFCGRCGSAMQQSLRKCEPAKVCTQCGFSVYPRISPCIICLIRRGDDVLLAKPAGRARNFYSLIAGFIEAGESAEQGVHREVYEEVGLQVKNVRYLLSQSWPFSHSLMLGFVADYAGGEIQYIDGEIAEADWFALDDLPNLPPKGTVAYQLIQTYLKVSENPIHEE
ncbi:MAG: NAD(+) diphosphatase [Pseudomonadota bacterium]|nr:NAD(+) diphosphatase [Pseudomonadota bacterium]